MKEEEMGEENRQSFKMRSRARQRARRKKQIILAACIAIACIVLVTLIFCLPGKQGKKQVAKQQPAVTQSAKTTDTPEPTEEPWSFVAKRTASTEKYGKDVVSKRGIVIDVDEGTILAEKGGKKQIYPASMTKILTVLVAAEHVTDAQLEEKVTITTEVTDYCYKNDCSAVGFAKNEKVPVKDLFYGTILPSGADAAVSLANYVAGSHEEFVKMMNDKVKELGLSETTHFTNCVGLYDDNHYSTPYDMAVILKAASENELCQKVLNARTYTTTKNKKHKKGILISNWFLRRIEDKDTHGEVLYAKTGFVNQSGNCAASMTLGKNGHQYICVTAGSTSSWRCIYDHVALYQDYIPKTEK